MGTLVPEAFQRSARCAGECSVEVGEEDRLTVTSLPHIATKSSKPVFVVVGASAMPTGTKSRHKGKKQEPQRIEAPPGPPMSSSMDPNETVKQSFAIDPEKWATWDASRREMLPWVLPMRPELDIFCCVFPCNVVCTPVCFPLGMACVGVSSAYGRFPESQPPGDEGLVLTSSGVRGYQEVRNQEHCSCCGYIDSWDPQTLAWHEFSKESISVQYTTGPPFACGGCCCEPPSLPNWDGETPNWDTDITCLTGLGVYIPCQYMSCYTKEIPGYYKMQISSIAGYQDNGQFEPDKIIHVRALREDYDKVIALLHQGLSENSTLSENTTIGVLSEP